MNAAEPRIYDLNISENYVPNWGAWEVGREVISNAIDADRAGYTTEIVSPDHIRVTTRTKPSLAQIKFIGGGTKRADGETIGCFGEGLKLAAMVAKRLGGDLRIRFDKYDVEYELTYHEDLGQRCATMRVTDVEGNPCEGTIIDVIVPGVAGETSGRFLKQDKAGPIEKRDAEKLIIYNKGVYVSESPQKSLFDWNLDTSINRDRNIIDMWLVGHNIARLLEAYITKAIALQIFEDREVFEMECIRKHSLARGARMARAFNDAFLERYGAGCIMASDDKAANAIATRLGKKVILTDEAIREVIMVLPPGERVMSAEEIVTKSDRLQMLDQTRFDLKELNELADILESPCEIFVFDGVSAKELGMAEFDNGKRRVLLSCRLFEPGARTMRLSTFVHEIAHIESAGGDGSIKFEDELTRLAGLLAKKALE